MAFIVGENEELIQAAKETMPFSVNLHVVPSVGLSDFNLRSSVAE
jgi:hypothetical protein